MLKAYKYRIYPNKEQRIFLSKSMGCSRYIYNKALETKIQHYQKTKKSLSYFDLNNTLLIDEKLKYDWLREPYSQTLQASLRNLDNAFKNFFHKTSRFPKFKKKHSTNSVIYPQHVKIDFKSSKVYIPKAGWCISVLHRKFEGKIKTCTISKTPTNKYFISILVDNKQELPKKQNYTEDTTIGIDLGIKTFATLSDGTKIDNPKYLNRSLRKLSILQQRLSRSKKGSKNREKAKLKVAKYYEKIINQRHDFLHKVSSKIISENQAIVLEDLDVKDMIERGYKNLSRNIGDVAWSTFINYLEYKSEWYGKNILKINRFDPSSKTCSECGYIKKDLILSDREWTCKNCNFHHDRDENAAKNIKRFGLIKPRLGRPVEPLLVSSV